MQHVADQALQLVGLLVTFPHISFPSGAGYMTYANGNRLGSGSSYTGSRDDYGSGSGSGSGNDFHHGGGCGDGPGNHYGDGGKTWFIRHS